MKKLIFLMMILFSSALFAQTATEANSEKKLVKKIVKAACGKCQYHMNGIKNCCLAVEVDGKKYLVEGSKMDDHGDPHKKGGLCRTVREAEVSGTIEDNKFLAYDFKLLPMDKSNMKLKEEEESPKLEDKL